jgi:hypothetical protein
MPSFRPRAPRGLRAPSALALTLGLALAVSCSSEEIDSNPGHGGASSMGGATSQAGTLNGNTPVVCSSGEHWLGGDRGSPLMHPGRACFTCHPSKNDLVFAVAGTVYPTAHEPDDCNGVNAASGAVIRLTDGNNVTHELKVNDAGNFYVPGILPTPFRASVVARGLERAMVAPQTSGDCNSCHTEAGSNGAPGRIVAP